MLADVRLPCNSHTETYGEMKMRKAVVAGIVGVGLLAGCMGNATATPTVLKSNSAASGSGYLTLTNNGTIETLVARGIDVDDLTLEPAEVTLNSLNLVEDGSEYVTLYSGSVDINGITVTGYVLTGQNQTTAQVLMPTNLIGSSLSSGIGPVVSYMPTGAHTYRGNSQYTVYAGGDLGSGTEVLGRDMSLDVDFSNGTGDLYLNNHIQSFFETLSVNSQTGAFNGLGDVDDNGLTFTTYGNIVGQNGEALVGVFDGMILDDVLIGGYVAER